MTEQRFAELFVGLAAHRQALIRQTQALVGLAHAVRHESTGLVASSGLALAQARRALGQVASDLDVIAIELASGLERLTKLADGTLEDTAVLQIDELADDE